MVKLNQFSVLIAIALPCAHIVVAAPTGGAYESQVVHPQSGFGPSWDPWDSCIAPACYEKSPGHHGKGGKPPALETRSVDEHERSSDRRQGHVRLEPDFPPIIKPGRPHALEARGVDESDLIRPEPGGPHHSDWQSRNDPNCPPSCQEARRRAGQPSATDTYGANIERRSEPRRGTAGPGLDFDAYDDAVLE